MKTNPIIVVNALMGSKGHQIARLIASCSNVRWYDHHWNGTNPWEPCSHILNHEYSKYHFDRREEAVSCFLRKDVPTRRYLNSSCNTSLHTFCNTKIHFGVILPVSSTKFLNF